jgi:hypothetical protein
MAVQAAASRDPLRVAVESFRPYWEIIQRRLGRDAGDPFNAADFCTKAKITQLEYDMVLRSMRVIEVYQTLSYDVVDKIMIAAGMEHLRVLLYVIDETEEREKRRERRKAKEKARATTRTRSHVALAALERRRFIKERWNQGATLPEIAEELGSSVKSVGVTMCEMRDDGWDLPHRGHRFKNRDEGLASAA